MPCLRQLSKAILAITLWTMGAGIGDPAAAQSDKHNIEVTLQEAPVTTPHAIERKLNLQITLPPKWKFYGQEPGEFGFAPRFDWSTSINLKKTEVKWPPPKVFKINGQVIYGYEGKTILPIHVTLENPGKPFTAKLKFEYLACGPDICLPQTVHLSYDFNEALSHEVKLFGTNTLWMILGAFVGGILLNFMPCVLPVVAIKAFQVIEGASNNYLRARKEIFASALGIVTSFIVLALGLIVLKNIGVSIGWGIQFQHPAFLAFLSLVLILFSGNLFGVFEFRLPYWFPMDTQAQGFTGAFFTGCLIMLLSTPCTAPMLGTAVGFAFHQPTPIILLIFFAIGLGLSIPYLLLGIYPKAVTSLLPKPGPWMLTFKKLLGGMVSLTALWVIFLLYYETNILTACSVFFLGILVVLVVGNIMTSYWIPRVSLLALSTLVAGLLFSNGHSSQPSSHFQASLPEQQAQNGQSSFVVITAEWCLTCKVNDKAVINTPDVQKNLQSAQINMVTADWTRANPEITRYMEKFGSSGVPFYALHTAKCPQGLPLPTLLSSEDITHAIKKCG